MALDCDVGLRTVHLIKPKLLTGDCLEKVLRSSRPETVQTFGGVDAVVQSNNGYPMQSINGLAEEFSSVEFTTRFVHKYRAQQDGAPAHTAKTTQKNLVEEL